MVARASELAARFRQINEEVLRCAQGCSTDEWRRMVPGEQRSIGFLIDHIAWAYGVERKAMQAYTTGREPACAPDELPSVFTREALDARNAERWATDPFPDKEGTIARLRGEGEETAAAIGALGDADLQRRMRYGWRPEMSVLAFVETLLIGHPGMHMPGIQRARASDT